MARTPTIRLAILAEAERAVLALPRAAQLAACARIAQLTPDLHPTQTYPREWILFRILGTPPPATVRTKSTTPTNVGNVQGAAILADLSPLLERVTAAIALEDREWSVAGHLTPTQLKDRWGCSMATLQRWRRQGLVWRRSRESTTERSRLLVAPTLVAWAEERDPKVRERAARFARVDAGTRDKMVKRALRYHAQLGWSLHRCAQRLAERFDHSVEGVRQVLRRDPRARVVFPQKRAITVRRRAAMLRLAHQGVDAAHLAQCAHRSPAIVRRELALARLHHLRTLEPLLRDAGAPDIDALAVGLDPLAPPGVRTGLRTPWATDLRLLIDDWRARKVLTNVEEREHAAAFQFLRTRCERAISTLDRLHPRMGDLDRIEIDLRWAGMLLVELVRSQHRLILETIEQRAATSAEQLAGPKLMEALHAGVLAASEAARRFDPTSGGRLAGTTGLSVDRAVTRVVRNWLPTPPTASRRAMAVLMPGVVIPDLATLVVPWERWTRIDPRIHRAVQAGALEPHDAKLLTLRFGLAGGAPRTLHELMDELHLDAIRVAHAESAAIRHALHWARTHPQPTQPTPPRP